MISLTPLAHFTYLYIRSRDLRLQKIQFPLSRSDSITAELHALVRDGRRRRVGDWSAGSRYWALPCWCRWSFFFFLLAAVFCVACGLLTVIQIDSLIRSIVVRFVACLCESLLPFFPTPTQKTAENNSSLAVGWLALEVTFTKPKQWWMPVCRKWRTEFAFNQINMRMRNQQRRFACVMIRSGHDTRCEKHSRVNLKAIWIN